MISPYSFRLFLHAHIHFGLSYSCTIVDYPRKILFNGSKIIYVSATMSIIDNYGALFTAQSICQTSYAQRDEDKYAEVGEGRDFRLPGKN